MEKLEFIASIPNIQSAINISGDQSVRLKFDVPASELPNILKLIAFYNNKAFKVTIGNIGEN